MFQVNDDASRTVGFLVVATGQYLPMALSLTETIGQVGSRDPFVVNLFTDLPESVVRREGSPFNVIPIPRLRWPEASLMRFELFHKHRDQLVGDVLMYSDADMRVVRPLDWALDQVLTSPMNLVGVHHPGYYRRGWRGPKGSWETRPSSSAYVPRSRRRAYAAGGIWLGTRSAVLSMCSTLALNVQRDQANGTMAAWHDESHWNWYVATHDVHLLSPAYCYAEGYPWLTGIVPSVVALEKGPDFVREMTDPDTLQAWGQAD